MASMTPAPPHVAVLGAGVNGLSCAVALAEAGLRVRVLADAAPADTVSAVAGGLWFPYGTERDDRSLELARATYARYEGLADDPAAAVALVDYLLLEAEDPWWAAAMPPGRVRPARPAELPAGYEAGWVARVPLVSSPAHLAWLEARARALGATFEPRHVEDLGELAELAPAVVDCAGLGARELCGDGALTGVRGQVVHLRPRPGARVACVADDTGPNALAYVLPRADVCVAGGTAEPAADAVPDEATRASILARCRAIEPGLEGATVLRDRAGLRPVRAGGPRLEAEPLGDGVVVHDYGHGGAGWTLAWGCALWVRDQVAAAL
jgi:D-amino-acid oxidase